jgi:hypothetical protein
MYSDVVSDALASIVGDYELTNPIICDMVAHMLYVIGLSDMCLPDGTLEISKDQLMELCIQNSTSRKFKKIITKHDLTQILTDITEDVLRRDYAFTTVYDESAVIAMLAKVMYAIETIDDPKNTSNNTMPRITQEAYKLYQQHMNSNN